MRIALLLTLAALAAGLVVAERRRAQAPVSAQSLLYLVADSERDLTRLPSRFTRLSDKEEIAAGNALASQDFTEKLSADGEEIEAYLGRLRARLAPHAHRHLPYRFHYVPHRAFINAYALPGGHVFVGAGLLERMTTEDELVSVLAHEIEHVDHYHCAERLQVEAALRKIPLGAVLRIPADVFQAGYSKDQELEADREGVLLAARSGYSAAGALRAFRMLDELAHDVETPPNTPQGEAAHVALDVLVGYFRSHPPTAERIAQVRTMIARQPQLAAAPEQPLAVEHIVLAWKALDAVSEEKFTQAAALASRSLQRRPGYAPALQALCEADYALGHDAANLYRELLARDPNAAAAIEKWGEERAAKWPHDRTIALLESLLTVQPSHPRLLRLAALAYAMKGDGATATEKASTLRRLYADTAPQIAAETEKSAAELLAENDFAPAAQLARVALTLDPTLRAAQQTLGDAEFAQAHFAAAAEAYKAMFDADNVDAAWLRSLADSLGAAHPATASGDLAAIYPAPSATAQVEIAGLALLSGNDAKGREVVQGVEKGAIAPELLARLGWWYLRAHRVADAEAVLVKARSLRPGDDEIQNALAWTALEEGKAPPPGDDVRDALAAWQRGRKAEALERWAQAKPQWRNALWRAALYPPRVDALAQQVEAERVRVAEAAAARFKRRHS
ncbi:MAG TPA: M48 family metalloprotease [Thermoanaerobaculia bacterium]|nr:M48 family metalloprotease [Thermoanaerobaculia bacterium]